MQKLRRPAVVLLKSLAVAIGLASARAVDAGSPLEADFFQREIEPLLKEHCYDCHSHAAGKMKGGLTLDSRSGWAEGGDGGPIRFRQMRVGLRGRTFMMWKFRSMVLNAEELRDKLQNEMSSNILFKVKNDPRITRIGKWLRRSSADELPQLWNVLRGDMSLVGPRPPLPSEVACYRAEDRQRLLAKPGLTCFWQVGGRTEIDFADQVRLDLVYIKSASLWVDIKLLFQTIPAVWLGKGAY